MSDILVTGATGFLGSSIVERLQRAGAKVHTTGRAKWPRQALPRFIPADLCCCRDLSPVIGSCSTIVHAAGLAHQFKSSKYREGNFDEVNAYATSRLFRAAIQAGVKNFVLISSIAVYGDDHAGALTEDCECRPIDSYARSKLRAEMVASDLARESGVRLTVLRMATTYGEGDPGNVARLMRAIERRRFVWIGSGLNRKSLIHRDDVGRACTLAALRKPTQNIETYNVTDGNYQMRDIVEGLAVALGCRLPRLMIPMSLMQFLIDPAVASRLQNDRVIQVRKTVAKWLADTIVDGRKFSREVGFTAQVALHEGLRRQVAWYQKEQSSKNSHLVA